MRKLPALLIALSLVLVVFGQQRNPRIANATRVDKNGWIYVHLEGKPGGHRLSATVICWRERSTILSKA